ncbi:MAG: ATP-binding protein, partial [Xanthomonadales bacterium]|nr:ATP-binding protein [Xanthomonadales bacterium]
MSSPDRNLPAHFPAWARQLAELYFSATTATFILHGNVADPVPLGGSGWGTLSEFLAGQLFGRWDLVLGYDLGRGLRPLGGADVERQRAMVALLNRRLGDLTRLPKDPVNTLAALDKLVLDLLTDPPGDRPSVALVIDYASFLVPVGDRLAPASAQNLVTLLNWASNPFVKQANLAFILIDTRLGDFHDRLVNSAHVSAIEVPMPTPQARHDYLQHLVGGTDTKAFSDFSLDQLSALTHGMSLSDLAVLIRASRDAGKRLDEATFKARKKRLIERQAQDLLEFIEPKFNLDMVVGHVAAKQRLRDDAELIRQGNLDVAPMGYLFNGPVGTGKTFLATCLAGSIGMPCIKLKNFRSKYVGESEANLERVLSVLRGLGPVMVIIDEADAMLGDRSQDGDSGVGSRIFGMIANAMGDTEYRGKIVWMLLTARPDLLPIDLKRQGRAEVHVPLFYPQTQGEIVDYFVVLAKKIGAKLDRKVVPDVPHVGNL